VAQVLVECLQRRPLLLLSFFSLGRRDGDGVRRGGGAGVGGRRRGGVGADAVLILRLPPLLQVDLREPLPPRAHDALVHVPGGVVVHADKFGLLGSRVVAGARGERPAAAVVGTGRSGCGDGELPRPPVGSLLGVGPRPLYRRELVIRVVAAGLARAGGLAAAHRRVVGGGGGAGEESRRGGGGDGSGSRTRLRGLLGRLRLLLGGAIGRSASRGVVDRVVGGPRRREAGESHVA